MAWPVSEPLGSVHSQLEFLLIDLQGRERTEHVSSSNLGPYIYYPSNFSFSCLGWGETEPNWYVGHYLAYRTGPE